MSDKQKPFIPPAVVSKKTAKLPSDGVPYAGGTQYHQYKSNNDFEILKGIQGHTQQSNIQPVNGLKRFVG